MKNQFLLFTLMVFTVGMASAQTSKKAGRAESVKPLPVKPSTKPAKAAESAPAFNALSNDLNQKVEKKSIAAKPGLMTDSLPKLESSFVTNSEVFPSPVIILAPIGTDKENQLRFEKLSTELAKSPRIKNKLITSKDGSEVLAIAINNPASLAEIPKNKENLFLKAYTFSSLQSLKESKDRYVMAVRAEKSIVDLILLQNTDFLPTTEEVKSEGSTVAP